MFTPTRVTVVAAREFIRHLQHCEHAAHFHQAKRAFAARHGQGTGRSLKHIHCLTRGVFRHTVTAHGHIARQHFAFWFLYPALLDAEHIWNAVAHGVHGVMGFMTVNGPVAGYRGEFDAPLLPDTDEFGDSGATALFGPASAIGGANATLSQCSATRRRKRESVQ